MKIRNILLVTSSLVAVSTVYGTSASAQSVWTGDSSGYEWSWSCPLTCPVNGNDDWNDADNWDGGIPNLSTDVVIGKAASGTKPVYQDTVTVHEQSGGTDASARSVSIGFAGNRSSDGGVGTGSLVVHGDLLVDQSINVGVTGQGSLENFDSTNLTHGNLVVGGQFASGSVINHAPGGQAGGTINVHEGNVVVSNGTFDNDGILNIDDGSLIVGVEATSAFYGDAASTLGKIGRDLVVGKSADGVLISDTDIDVAGNTTIGVDAGVDGNLTIRNGADVTTDGALTVGDHGNATFAIGAAGDPASLVTTGGKVVIGNESGSVGVVELTNGSMHNGSTLTVGNDGDGDLLVSEGSSVDTAGEVKLGVETGATGYVQNSGTIQNGRRLVIGDAGTGAFFTQGSNASTHTDGDVVLGEEHDGLGIVVVDDGGDMSSSGRLDVGRDGHGYVLVDDGGSLSDTVGTMGRGEDSRGFAAVVGEGSLWDNTESLTVAQEEGAGAVLVISEGGTVRVGEEGAGTLTIAAQEGSTGILNIGAYSYDTENGYGFDADVDQLLDGENYDNSARAAGTLDATTVRFGEGNGVVNFKTTETEADDYRFKAGFAGDGTVNHYAGFTILDGDSSEFTGDVNITGGTLVANGDLAGSVTVGTAGVLRIGNAGETGDVFNDVVNDGRVEFGRSDVYTYDGVISGAGDVAQIGAGTTIVTAENTYTGRTAITDGTLQLGDGGESGSIDGTSRVWIGSDGTLAFNRSDDVTWDRNIRGWGAIRQAGTGTTSIDNNNWWFRGETFVDAGTLSVNGALLGTFDVNDGGTLAGTGYVGTTVVHDGGTISPGNSIGTLTVLGDLTQHEGSTYEAEVLSTGESDLIHVTGSAAIDDGAILNVTKLDDDRYDLDRRYTVLTADGGLAGDYTLTGDTFVSAFYRVEDQYDDNNAYLKVNQHRLLREGALTQNQIAAATAAQELKAQTGETVGYETTGRPTNALFRALAYLPTDELAQHAFDQISGEIHASVQTGLLEQSRFSRDAATQRIRDAFGGVGAKSGVSEKEGLSIWGHGYGSWSDTDGDGNAGSFSHNAGGLFIGADAPVAENFRIGVLGGYGTSSFRSSGRGSTANSDNIDLGIYGGAQFERLGLRLGANYSWNSLSTDRSIQFPGFSDRAKADYDARTAQIYGDVGYRLDLGQASFEPFAGLAYVSVKTDGYSESGNEAALSGKSNTVDTTFMTLGLRGSTAFDMGSTPVKATGMLGWRHAFDALTPTATHSFDGSSAFTVAGVPLSQDVALVEAGLETALSEGITLGLSYSGQFGSGFSDHGVRGNLNWKY